MVGAVSRIYSPFVRYALVIAFLLGATGCGVPMGIEMKLQIRRYSGDGSIRTCGNLLAPGYAIDFPKFDTSRPYSASYRLTRLPRVYDPLTPRKAHIYLRSWQNVNFEQSLGGSVRVDLVKTSGQLAHSFELPLAGVLHGNSQGRDLFSDIKTTELHFEKNVDYILRVSYSPGLIPLRSKELFFTIRDCAEY